MDEFIAALKECGKLALTPATIFGAGGGLIRAIRRRGSWKQIITEMLGGIFVANMVFPVVATHLPVAWHYTAFFLVGWGGIEMVGWAYTSAAEFVRLWALRKAGLTVDELERLRRSDDPERYKNIPPTVGHAYEHNYTETPLAESGTPSPPADTPNPTLEQENMEIR